MILKQTQVSQRTLTDSWRDPGSVSGIPVGVILDISVNTPGPLLSGVTPCRVGISSMSSDGSSITCTLVRLLPGGKTEHISTVTTSDTAYPVAFDCPEGYSASVLFGYVPEELSFTSTDPILISNTCVTALYNYIDRPRYELVVSDGTGDPYQLDGRYVVKVDKTLAANVDDNQTLKLSLSDYGISKIMSYTVSDNTDKYILKSINNIAGSHITISISVNGSPIRIDWPPRTDSTDSTDTANIVNYVILDYVAATPTDEDPIAAKDPISAEDPISTILDSERIKGSTENRPLLNLEVLPKPVDYELNTLYDVEDQTNADS